MPENETKSLTFGQALEELAKGKKVRKKDWVAEHLSMAERVVIHTESSDSTWRPYKVDLLTEEWEVVE